MPHRLSLEETSYGHWGECSCEDWSTGPTTKAEARKDHAAHVRQRSEDIEFGLWDEVDA